MAQDSQQVLGDEIGRILSEAGVTEEQAKYLRNGFVEMIQKNTIVLQHSVHFDDPVVNLHHKRLAINQGITAIAETIIKKNIFKVDTKDGEVVVAIHLIRNAGL
jgi:hypothetical protein